MRFVKSGYIAAVLLALMPSRAEVAQLDCHLKLKTGVDMLIDDSGRVTVPVLLNGKTKRMMIDTGAANSAITGSLTKELGLKISNVPDLYIIGFAGRINAKKATVAEFSLGRLKARDLTFFVDANDALSNVDLFGADFLSNYDLDFDFAKGRLNLVSPEHCPGDVVYWTKGNYGVVPFELSGDRIRLTVKLDGEEFGALLDTGAADTPMNLTRVANELKLDRTKLERSGHYPFKSLSVGDVTVTNPSITLIPDGESILGHGNSSLHMILGMNVLRQLHLYISYKEKKIYVTPATQY